MITNFFDKTAIIKSLTATTSSSRTIENWTQTDLHTFPCNVQPASMELVAQGQGHFYNTHTVYCQDDVSLKVGDTISIDDIEYLVQGIQTRAYGSGRVNHQKLGVIERQ